MIFGFVSMKPWLDEEKNYLYNYYENQEGLEKLENLFEHYFFDESVIKVNQLVIASGTQQALFILSRIDFPGQAQVLVEQPTYHRIDLLLAQNIPIKPLNVGWTVLI